MKVTPQEMSLAVARLVEARVLSRDELLRDPARTLARLPDNNNVKGMAGKAGLTGKKVRAVIDAAVLVRQNGRDFLQWLAVQSGNRDVRGAGASVLGGKFAEYVFGIIPPPLVSSGLSVFSPIVRWDDPEFGQLLGQIPPHLRWHIIGHIATTMGDGVVPLLVSLQKEQLPGKAEKLLGQVKEYRRTWGGKMGEILHKAFAATASADDINRDTPPFVESLVALTPFFELQESLSHHRPSLPLQGTPVKAVSSVPPPDQGGRPHRLIIDFSCGEAAGQAIHLEFISTFLSHFSRAEIVLSVEDQNVPSLADLLDHNPLLDRSRISIAVRFLSGSDQDSHQASWPRDHLLATEDQDGIRFLHVSKSIGRHSLQTYHALALEAGSHPAPPLLEDYEGGQYLFGQKVGLVGINELAKLGEGSLLFDKTASKRANFIATFAGRKVIFVGDPVYGQGLPHIDLYMDLISDTSIVVTDFRRGWQILLAMSSSELEALKQEFQHNLEELNHLIPHQINDNEVNLFYLALIEAAQNPQSPLRRFIEKWLPSFQKKIDQEIDQLARAGFQMTRIPGLPFPNLSFGTTYTNTITHQADKGLVKFLPSYGGFFDTQAKEAYRHAGYQGNFVFLPGLGLSQIHRGGGARCMTYVMGPPKQTADRADYFIPAADLSMLMTKARDQQNLLIEASRNSNPIAEKKLETVLSKAWDFLVLRFPQMNEHLAEEGRVKNAALALHRLGMLPLKGVPSDRVLGDPEYWSVLLTSGLAIVLKPEKVNAPSCMFEVYNRYKSVEFKHHGVNPHYGKRVQSQPFVIGGKDSLALEYPDPPVQWSEKEADLPPPLHNSPQPPLTLRGGEGEIWTRKELAGPLKETATEKPAVESTEMDEEVSDDADMEVDESPSDPSYAYTSFPSAYSRFAVSPTLAAPMLARSALVMVRG